MNESELAELERLREAFDSLPDTPNRGDIIRPKDPGEIDDPIADRFEVTPLAGLRNGDGIYIKGGGKLAIWDHENGSLEEISMSLIEFLRRFADDDGSLGDDLMNA